MNISFTVYSHHYAAHPLSYKTEVPKYQSEETLKVYRLSWFLLVSQVFQNQKDPPE